MSLNGSYPHFRWDRVWPTSAYSFTSLNTSPHDCVMWLRSFSQHTKPTHVPLSPNSDIINAIKPGCVYECLLSASVPLPAMIQPNSREIWGEGSSFLIRWDKLICMLFIVHDINASHHINMQETHRSTNNTDEPLLIHLPHITACWMDCSQVFGKFANRAYVMAWKMDSTP